MKNTSQEQLLSPKRAFLLKTRDFDPKDYNECRIKTEY
jgi:hypothetical protein